MEVCQELKSSCAFYGGLSPSEAPEVGRSAPGTGRLLAVHGPGAQREKGRLDVRIEIIIEQN